MTTRQALIIAAFPAIAIAIGTWMYGPTPVVLAFWAAWVAVTAFSLYKTQKA